MAISASDIRINHEIKNPESLFFTKDSMRFFGDTMGNYAVSSKPVKVETYFDGIVECYELRRKKPVNGGLQSSDYFCTKTYARIIEKVKG